MGQRMRNTVRPDMEMLGTMRRLREITIPTQRIFSEKKGLEVICFSEAFVRHILPRIEADIVPTGNLGVNKLRQHFHDESIESVFSFLGEGLDITPCQFLWGCVGLFARQPDKCTIIGYVPIDGARWTVSEEKVDGERHFDADAPDKVHKQRNPGDLILSPAFQPAPVLSRHFEPYALI